MDDPQPRRSPSKPTTEIGRAVAPLGRRILDAIDIVREMEERREASRIILKVLERAGLSVDLRLLLREVRDGQAAAREALQRLDEAEHFITRALRRFG
jgi:hypothetical protein